MLREDHQKTAVMETQLWALFKGHSQSFLIPSTEQGGSYLPGGHGGTQCPPESTNSNSSEALPEKDFQETNRKKTWPTDTYNYPFPVFFQELIQRHHTWTTCNPFHKTKP